MINSISTEPDLKGVVHKPTKGVPPAPQPLPGRGGLACKYRPSTAYCFRNVYCSEGVPCSMLVSGSIELQDVPGAHLDYVIEQHIGVIIGGDELSDPPPEIGRPAYYLPAVAMNVYETYVPESRRGQGVGRRLARAVFKVAETYGWYVQPSCTYIANTFLRGATGEEFEPLVLFTATADGKGVAARRAELTAMSIPTLKAMGGHGRNRNNNKPIIVERLLQLEFGQRRRRRAAAAACEAKCRSLCGIGCGGCAACGGRGYCGYDHPILPAATQASSPRSMRGSSCTTMVQRPRNGGHRLGSRSWAIVEPTYQARFDRSLRVRLRSSRRPGQKEKAESSQSTLQSRSTVSTPSRPVCVL